MRVPGEQLGQAPQCEGPSLPKEVRLHLGLHPLNPGGRIGVKDTLDAFIHSASEGRPSECASESEDPSLQPVRSASSSLIRSLIAVSSILAIWFSHHAGSSAGLTRKRSDRKRDSLLEPM